MKNKKSVALRYDGNYAPKIIYKGERLETDKMLTIARKFDIPVLTDQSLTEALYSCDVDDYVPEELWEIIAGIYAFIISVKNKVYDEEQL